MNCPITHERWRGRLVYILLGLPKVYLHDKRRPLW